MQVHTLADSKRGRQVTSERGIQVGKAMEGGKRKRRERTHSLGSTQRRVKEACGNKS